MEATRIGYINACIAGDTRYTSKIEVHVLGDQVMVQRWENGAVGGMDGPGGSYGFSVQESISCSKDPSAILKAIKRAMDDTIKRYGKPTKNFVWATTKDRGLSVAKCQKALGGV